VTSPAYRLTEFTMTNPMNRAANTKAAVSQCKTLLSRV
jgi:hypothetical protein